MLTTFSDRSEIMRLIIGYKIYNEPFTHVAVEICPSVSNCLCQHHRLFNVTIFASNENELNSL